MTEDNAHLEKVKQSLDPSFLEQYELVKMLGSGAMGMVIEARQIELDRPVAIKFVIENNSLQTELWKRFKREAQAMARMRHPNICPLFDYGISNEHPYLVTELLKGYPLNEFILRQGRIPVEEAVPIIRQIAAGLACAHELGIVHRDLKPANIFICEDNRVKVVDFGLVSSLGAQTQLTQTGSVIGTPLYMSPEQVTGVSITSASDIFSMGIIAYELVTGRLPSNASSMLSLLKEKMKGKWTPLRMLQPPEVPEKLCQLIDECMALEYDDRPDALEVIERLTAYGKPERDEPHPIESGVPADPGGPVDPKELVEPFEAVPPTNRDEPKTSKSNSITPYLAIPFFLLVIFILVTKSKGLSALQIVELEKVNVQTTSALFSAKANKKARAELTIINSLDGHVIKRVGQGAMKDEWHFQVNGLPPGTAMKAILSLSSQGKNLAKSIEIMTELLEAKRIFKLPYEELPREDRRISDVPILAGNRYTFSLAKGCLSTIDLASGKVLFKHGNLPAGNLRCDGPRLFYYCRNFELYAFTSDSLELLWKVKLPKKGYAARYFIDGPYILLRLNDGGYICLSKEDGKERWRVEDHYFTRPYNCGGGVLVTNHLTSARLPFWDLETGKQLEKSAMNKTGLALTLTRYFAGEFYLGLVPHRLLVGNPRKSVRLDIDTYGMCDQLSVSGDRIVLLTEPKTMTCYDRISGKELWHKELERNTPDSYLRAEGRYVFMMHAKHSFECWDIETGSKLFQWKCDFYTGSEILCHGNEIVFSADGYIQRMTIN